MIKWIKTAFLVILCVALLALIILWRLSAGNESSEKEEANASCDYFNGEVVEITDEYFILKPIAEWTWKETTRVKTPKTNVAQKIVALKTGDLVRVAFNSKAMEWKEDEVLIPVAFAFYSLTEDGKLRDVLEEGYAIQYEFESDDMAWFFHNLSYRAKAGTIVDVRTDLLLDADILIWVDGQELKKSYDDGNGWVYSFTMPDRDVIVTAKMSGKKEGQKYVLAEKNDTIAVVMEVSDITPTGLTVHFRQYEKRDKGELIYGDGYWIERLEGDHWVELPVIPENYGFNDIGYFIPSEGEAQLAVDWEWLYGKLDSGTYRITKDVIAKEWSDPNSRPLKCLLATQFIIE